jgi:hypothetical protein
MLPDHRGRAVRLGGSYQSVREQISTDRKRSGGKFTLAVIILPNTQATVHIPASGADMVIERGQPAARAKGVHFLH